ncbi:MULTISPECIES: hypothetical protein [Acinetobacter]|uniref:hypothetical protein n=1 Tax=Acinetobacter TaxID=469 RepID=UPI0020969FCC|nr:MULTISPECIES: hypothetical protein [Acinetobacter]MCO8083119.1 hypothetical protein [Acinetobacter lwoffii]
MIKRIIQTFIVLSVLNNVLVIYYWRDTQYDPSNIDFLLYFGILPLLICLLLLTPYFIYKAVKSYKQRQQEQKDRAHKSLQAQQQELENKEELDQAIEDYTLNIFSAAAWHSFGENAEILQHMKQFKSPELDSELLNRFGLPILTYRIHSVDRLLEENGTSEEMLPTLQEQRIQQLIQQQLEQHEESLSLISEKLKRSALFYDHELAYEYRMHPGWIQENYCEDEGNIASNLIAVSRLNRLNLHILLADHMTGEWSNLYQEQLISQIQRQYALLPVQIHTKFYLLSADHAYSALLELLQEISGQSHEISLIIMADSEIDQDCLDQQFWQNEEYIAAEYTASWCLSAHDLEVEGMMPSRILTLSKYVTDLYAYLGQNQVDLSYQLEQAHPFLVLLDDTTQPKIMKKIQEKFTNIDFEPEPTIYPQSYVGHTQHLAVVFAAMMSSHLSDNVITIGYSTQQESSYLYFKNKESDQLNEISLVA